MNDKCLILGAGFSKAVAGLPIMKDMLQSFKNEIERNENIKHPNSLRAKWGENIFSFLEKLENDFLITPYEKTEIGGKIIESNYLENFEALCSYIDLNISFEIKARCEYKGVKSPLWGKPMFANYDISFLKKLRDSIGTYIYLALLKDKSDKNLLNMFHKNFLKNLPTVISFNYDLVLDKFLFTKNIWFPADGYGFDANIKPEISNNYLNCKSKIKLLKMHGSQNWKTSCKPNHIIGFEWCDDDSNYFFAGYLKTEIKRNEEYQGGFATNSWLLPSWIKQFNYPEIIEVWKQAAIQLRMAKELIFIGYSMPKADSAVYSLFISNEPTEKKVTIIDPNADELKEHFSQIFLKRNIICINRTLEEYLLNKEE